MDIRLQKKQLREEYMAKRRALPAEQRAEIDAAVCSVFLSSASFRLADTLLAYAPKGAEVDVMPIVLAAIRQGKKVAFPLCEENHTLTFRYALPEELIPGTYGIMEPSADMPIVSEFNAAVCLVPALLFDREGYRVGYGKGYYDRFLPNFHGQTVGVARNDFILPSVPRGRFDFSVDMIVSETGVILLS